MTRNWSWTIRRLILRAAIASTAVAGVAVSVPASAQVRMAPPIAPAPTSSPATAAADPAASMPVEAIDDPAELERIAVGAVRAGDTARGERALRRLLAIEPQHREAVVALGDLLLGTRPQEAEAFLAPYVQAFPGDGEIEALYARSRAGFAATPNDVGMIDVGAATCRVGSSVDRSSRFYGTLRISERYDDFPGVVPTANVFGGPTNRTNSFGNLAAANLNYDLIRLDDFTLTGGYDGFYTHYYEPSSSRFDILQHGGYLAGTRRGYTPFGDLPFSMTLRGDYDNVSADQDPYLQRYGAGLSTTVEDSDWTSMTAAVRYTNFDYLNRSTTLLPGFLFATPGDPDSDNYAVGFSRRWLSCDRSRTWDAGYFYDRNEADASQFSYHGHKIFAGLSVQFPLESVLSAQVAYYRRDYDDAGGAYRADDELLLTVRYLEPLWRPDLYLFAEYAYDLNQSTIAANQYDRNVFDIGLQWNFGR